jgi:adenylosuccinate lyase
MSRTDIESLTEVKLHRQKIREQMENLHLQRRLVEKLERDGKDTKAARQSLREMLITLEGFLEDHNRTVEPNSK